MNQTINIGPQPGPQTTFLALRDVDEIILAGSRGGGKSFALLLDVMQFLREPEEVQKYCKALVLRETMPQLRSLISLARELFRPFKPKFNSTTHIFTFKSGFTVQFGYLSSEKDMENYQGQAYNFIGYDEAGNLESEEIWTGLLACLRPENNVPDWITIPKHCFRARLTANPSGKGVGWIKKRFEISLYREGYHLITDEKTGMTRIYIPSVTLDNEAMLKNDPNYLKRLEGISDPRLKAAWLDNDWEAFAGQYFSMFNNASIVNNQHGAMFDQIIKGSSDICLAYDHGYSHNYALMSVAKMNKSVFVGSTTIPAGSLVVFNEITGNKETVSQIGEKINEHKRWLEDRLTLLKPGSPDRHYSLVADNAINGNTGVGSVADDFRKRCHIVFKPSDKSRIAGWSRMMDLMRGEEVDAGVFLPKLYICDNCKKLLDEISTAVPDKNNPEDMAKNNDDCLDALRYGIMHLS